MMDDQKMNQLADDVHLIASPFRFVGETLKILLFILALPIVFVIALIHSTITGAPLLGPDLTLPVEILLTVLHPFLVLVLCGLYTRWGQDFRSKYPNRRLFKVSMFFADIPLVLFLVWCNFNFGWGYYQDDVYYRNGVYGYGYNSAWIALSPVWITVAIFILAALMRRASRSESDGRNGTPTAPVYRPESAEELDKWWEEHVQLGLYRMHNKIGEPDVCWWCKAKGWTPEGALCLKTEADLAEFLRQHKADCTIAIGVHEDFLKRQLEQAKKLRDEAQLLLKQATSPQNTPSYEN
jgi:hypothetical protein